MPKKINFDKEEIETLKSAEKGEWKSVKNLDKEIKKYSAIARENLKKDQRINIRVSQKDLEDIKRLALRKGMPYQTLISSIIHRYNNGDLVERKEVV